MIGAMTERGAAGPEGQIVCPFVAFDDDRDYRSDVPDRRHRCFAESPAATRALAHQAAYCLSASFPGCPTFLDWARREAAPPKEQPVRTLREAPNAPRLAERSGDKASRAVPPPDAPPPPRRGRAEWTAPPPWAAEAEARRERRPAAGAGDFEEPDVLPVPAAPPAAEDSGGPGFGAWSGSALAGIVTPESPTAGTDARPPEVVTGLDAEPRFVSPEPAAPPFLAGRATRQREAADPGLAAAGADVSRDAPRAVPPRRRPVSDARGTPVQSQPVGRGRDRVAERLPDRSIDRGIEREIADPAAPAWERPRRFEAYPSLRSGGGGLASLPRPVLYGLIILVAGVALFVAPFVFRGLTSGGGGAAATPTPSASASAPASAAPSVTPVPSRSPTVYTVKAGDTLSRIAGKYGLTVDQIVKANPQIKDPNKLGLGDQLVIPPAVAPAITDSGTLTPAPSTAAP
jgi:LysM repeat protein